MTLCVEINKNKKSDTYENVKDDEFVVIRGFMRKELKLEKTELLVYAIIHGFYCSGYNFTGGVKYLSEWSGSGRTAVKAALSRLIKKGLIVKTVKKINNIERAEYKIAWRDAPMQNAECKMQNAECKLGDGRGEEQSVGEGLAPPEKVK